MGLFISLLSIVFFFVFNFFLIFLVFNFFLIFIVLNYSFPSDYIDLVGSNWTRVLIFSAVGILRVLLHS